MDKTSHWSIVEQQIMLSVNTLLPNSAGTVTDIKLRHVMNTVAQIAFQQGGTYALLSLLTVEDIAEKFDVSPRRVRALAQVRHERFGVGWQVPGTRQWLFRPEEIESLRPGIDGYPKGRPRNLKT